MFRQQSWLVTWGMWHTHPMWSDLALQPQGGGATAVVEAEVGSIMLDVRLPGARHHDDIRIHIILLLRGIALNVEDHFLASLQVLRASLLLEHGRDRGVVDVASVPRGVGGIGAIQRAIRF